MGALVAILLGAIILWAYEGSLQAKDWIDIVLTIATITVAVIALYVSHQTSKWQKEHNLESVRPFLALDFNHEFDQDEKLLVITIKLKNIGLGPAIVKSMTLKSGDEICSFEQLAAILADGRDILYNGHYRYLTSERDGLAINQSVVLGKYNIEAKNQNEANVILKNIQPVTLDVQYKSFHEQPFELSHSGKELFENSA
jgi:hypothetical protein